MRKGRTYLQYDGPKTKKCCRSATAFFAVNPIWDLVGVDFFGDLKVGKEHHQNATHKQTNGFVAVGGQRHIC